MPDIKYIGEAGQTGKQIHAGQLSSDDWVSELTGQALITAVDRMRNDAIINALETGLFMPITQAQYSIAYENEELNKKNQAILDFVNEDFAKINWSKTFQSMLTAIPYGFSITEPVYTLVNDKIRLTKLAPRSQSTVWKWRVTPHGEFKSIQQYVFCPDTQGENGSWKYIDLPAERIILLSHKMENGNLEGKSEYRSIFREWKIKDRLYRKMMVTIDRVGAGIPYALLKDNAPAGDATGNVKGVIDNMEEVMKGLLSTENSYIVAQYVDSVGLLSIDPASITTMKDLIKHCDESMAKAMMQLYLNLGTSETGSRSLGNTFEALYYERIYSIAEELTDTINNQLLRRYIRWNFGPQKEYPKMSLHFDKNLDAVSDVLTKLKTAGLVQGNKDLENFVNEWYGLPLTTKENTLAVNIAPSISPVIPMTDKCDCKTLTLSEKKRVSANRVPNEIELKLIDLDDTINGLNTIQDAAAQEIRTVAEPYAQEMAKAIGRGEKFYTTSIKWGNSIADTILKYYKKMVQFAQDRVKKEMLKQGKKLSDRLFLAEKTPQQLFEENFQALKELANIQSEILRKDLEKAIIEYYSTASAQGLKGVALTNYIVDKLISEVGQRYDQIAGQITATYGNIREIAVKEFEDVVTSKIRTELMDSNTCGHCLMQDGKTYAKKDGQWIDKNGETAPNLRDESENPCEGFLGNNHCRGVYLYEIGA